MSDDDRLRDMALALTEHLRHQVLSAALRDALLPAVREAGLKVYLTINLRLRTGRIFIPDLVVCQPVDLDTLVIDAASVKLVCEVTSTDVGNDRILKTNYYADAGIPRYLIVDPKGPVLELYKLDGGHYVEEQLAVPGERLLFTTPIVTEIDPASLAE